MLRFAAKLGVRPRRFSSFLLRAGAIKSVSKINCCVPVRRPLTLKFGNLIPIFAAISVLPHPIATI
jgi:hypothetical protein